MYKKISVVIAIVTLLGAVQSTECKWWGKSKSETKASKAPKVPKDLSISKKEVQKLGQKLEEFAPKETKMPSLISEEKAQLKKAETYWDKMRARKK